MKGFLCKVILFLLTVFLIDCFAGVVFPKLIPLAKGGDTWRNGYICDRTNEDILVFGSSRAIHHYNPTIITDSLGLSCYNCGQDSQGIILNFGRLGMIEKRYTPKYVIYDVTPAFDLLGGEDNHKYLKWLKAYYNREGVAEIFESVDKTEKFKMVSNLYRYNSNFVQIVADCIHPFQSVGINGYRPLFGKMDAAVPADDEKNEIKDLIVYDGLKQSYWDKLLETDNSYQLIIVVSPIWGGMSKELYGPLESICKEKGILFIDFANSEKYVHNNDYFVDATHLNSVGADMFTKDLVAILKNKGL